MNRPLLLAAVLVSLGCSATTSTARAQDSRAQRARHRTARVYELPLETVPTEPPAVAPAALTPTDPWADPMATLDAAAARAQPGARRVLETIHTMLEESVVVRGACNAWTNAVFHRAGGRARAVFHGDRRASFTATSLLAPGDRVAFINHSFGDVTHAAIFVAWIDEPARSALMVSYPGGNRDAPGRFSGYELSNVYEIVRMADALDEAPSGRARRR